MPFPILEAITWKFAPTFFEDDIKRRDPDLLGKQKPLETDVINSIEEEIQY